MKTILIIGIGAGNPDYVTIQAVDALNRVDVFFVMDKGAAKDELVALRKEICRRFITGDAYRFVEVAAPERDPATADYQARVEDVNAEKQRLFERLIAEELEDGQVGAVMVWGDPSLYDSTIRIVERIAEGPQAIDYEVIPGITAIQALTARHRTTLNRIGRSVAVTTGREIAGGLPDGLDVVVMLDGENTYKRFAGEDLEIFWGAYLGTPDEILVSGRLPEVAEEIERRRAEARAAKGWIMDTYLMRRAE